jgi:molecular chaperone GrpE
LAKKSKKTAAPETESATESTQDIPAGETAEPVDPLFELQNEVAAAKAEASKNWDLYLRERADLENARKRHQREKEDAIRFANDRLLKEMIPVLDNLERAVEHAGQGAAESKGLLEGVSMTITQFRKALEDFGVKPIKAIGEVFDPNLHQAMGQMESAEQAPNTVVTEFQKGYLLHDRLLRPSLVMVAKAPADASTDQKTEDSSPAGT